MEIIERLQKNKNFILILLGGMVITSGLTFVIRPFDVHVMIMVLIWAVLGLGWNLIGGYTGYSSNGHALFMAIGAYSCALLIKWFQITPWISIWVGVIISVMIAFIIGMPLLKLKGQYFAVATMCLAECARIILLNFDAVGGSTGVSYFNRTLPPILSWQFKTKQEYFLLYLGVFVVILILAKILDKTKFGYYLRAIKGNEDSAQCVGIDTTKYKVLAYLLSAAIVSIGGSMWANYLCYIDPYTLLPLSMSMMICLVPIMGGVGTVVGPILGAIVLTAISQYTTSIFVGTSGLSLFLYGVLVIIMVLFLPDGLISLFKKKRKKIDLTALLEPDKEKATNE